MAACDVSQLLTDSACRTRQVLTTQQQKQLLLYAMWQSATLIGGAAVSNVLLTMINDSVCFRTVSEAQRKAFLIQSWQNAYGALSGGAWSTSDADALTTMACIDGLSDDDMNATISYLMCKVLSNLPLA